MILAQQLDTIAAVSPIRCGCGEIIDFDDNVSEGVDRGEILGGGESLVREIDVACAEVGRIVS